MTVVPIPLILRGKATDSGSAQLAVIIALQPCTEVLCSAPEVRLREMFDEVFAVLVTTGVAHTVRFNMSTIQVMFENGSRILFRQPRRDGKGVQGVNPALIWLDEADRFAELEAVAQVKSSKLGVPVLSAK